MSLCLSFLFVSIIVVVLALFVVTVPVSNSIETASDGVRSIYSGAVILIGGLLAYKIGGEYIKNPFSISDALKKAMFKIEKDPFGKKPKQDWEKLSEEGRLTDVLKEIIESKCQALPPQVQQVQ